MLLDILSIFLLTLFAKVFSMRWMDPRVFEVAYKIRWKNHPTNLALGPKVYWAVCFVGIVSFVGASFFVNWLFGLPWLACCIVFFLNVIFQYFESDEKIKQSVLKRLKDRGINEKD